MPLARMKELLATDPDRFAVAVAEIDRKLQERVELLQRTRERLARLPAGDRLFVSAEVADFLDRLRELGVSERTVQMERDGWILLQAVSPKEAAVWIADKCGALRDPEFGALYLECDAASGWSPDDQRLFALADRIRRWTSIQHRSSSGGERPIQDPTIAQLVARSVGTSSPAWDRLTELSRGRAGNQ